MCPVHAFAVLCIYPSGSSHPAPTSLPAATTHSLPPSTTSVPVLRPVTGCLPSNVADPQTIQGQHPDGRFLPGPSPSSMLCSLFPQGMPMSWSNPAPSKYYSASFALMQHPLGFYANPYFGPYHPPGFFSGLQYYPQRWGGQLPCSPYHHTFKIQLRSGSWIRVGVCVLYSFV